MLPTSGPARPSHGKLPALTGLRGLASLLVVFAHLGWNVAGGRVLHLGELGVMVFFSLSGFLMALIYLDQPFSHASARGYLVARFARIAPAYLTVVVAGYLICTWFDSDFVYQLTNRNIVRHLLFAGNQAVFWSVPPEVQFYALFVALWFAFAAFVVQRTPVWLAAVVLGMLVLVGLRVRFPGTFVGASIHLFLLGVLAGLARHRLPRLPVGIGSLTALQLVPVVLFVLLILGVIGFGDRTNKDLYASLPYAVGAVALVFVHSYDTPWSQAAYGNRLLRLCGDCSFSIYLLHEPVIYWMRQAMPAMPQIPLTIGAIVVVILASYALFRVVEMPGSRLINELYRATTPLPLTRQSKAS